MIGNDNPIFGDHPKDYECSIDFRGRPFAYCKYFDAPQQQQVSTIWAKLLYYTKSSRSSMSSTTCQYDRFGTSIWLIFILQGFYCHLTSIWVVKNLLFSPPAHWRVRLVKNLLTWQTSFWGRRFCAVYITFAQQKKKGSFWGQSFERFCTKR